MPRSRLNANRCRAAIVPRCRRARPASLARARHTAGLHRSRRRRTLAVQRGKRNASQGPDGGRRPAGRGPAGRRPACRHCPSLERRRRAHILPTVSHERALLTSPCATRSTGRPCSTSTASGSSANGRTWSATAGPSTRKACTGLGLPPRFGATPTTSRFATPGRPSTFPAPGDQAAQASRVLFFTCAGGHDVPAATAHGDPHPAAGPRARFDPHVSGAIGDHVYWDLRSGPASIRASPRIAEVGQFARVKGRARRRPQRGGAETRRGPQIVPLYGTRAAGRSPTLPAGRPRLLRQRRGRRRLITFRPTPSCCAASRATQRLYYPDSCPMRRAPLGLGGTRVDGPCRRIFGTLRYRPVARGAAVRLPPLDWRLRRRPAATSRRRTKMARARAWPTARPRDLINIPPPRPAGPPANGANGTPIEAEGRR